jgi:hypothetical protein
MSCLDNNKFISSDSNCNAEYKGNTKLDLYYQPVINYCQTNDNINNDFCTDFYNTINNKYDTTNLQKFNLYLNDNYSKWNLKWKENGCFTDLPIPIYNQLISLSSDADRVNKIIEYRKSNTIGNRNTCYSGESLEVEGKLYYNNCLYSQNKKFKLCQSKNGDLVLYNIPKNTNKIINSIKNGSNFKLPFLLMQADGNVVNYNIDGGSFWSTGTQANQDANGKNAFIVLRNDGKIILYNQDGKLVQEINSIEAFENDVNKNCCTADEIINNADCNNQYVESYKIYLNDMNNYCKSKNNIIDNDMCDELFNNEFNLNDHDTLADRKKIVCLDPANYLNNKCVQFNVQLPSQLNQQADYCKYSPFDSKCNTLYQQYKQIKPNNNFVNSKDNMFILFIVMFCILIASGIGGAVFYFRYKQKIKINKKNIIESENNIE